MSKRTSPGIKAPPADQDKIGRLDLVTFASILSAVLLAYLPALRGSLVWDDTGHLTRPELRSLHGLWRIWFDLGATQQYYPLLHSAFWLEHSVWGDAVLGYHLWATGSGSLRAVEMTFAPAAGTPICCW